MIRWSYRDRKEIRAGFAEAKAERRQIREEAAAANRRLVWIGGQPAWMRAVMTFLAEPAAQQGAASRG